MSGPASTQSFQIEALLHSYGEALAARRTQDAPARAPRFDGRSLVAGFLAFVICAPGCAAAAFLMKSEDVLSSAGTAVSRQPSISKSNRLPLSQWKAKAPVSVARVAVIADDASFLGPVAIRGRLEEEILAAAVATEVAAPVDTTTAPSRPRRKHEVRRTRPVEVVAEAALPEPTPPPPSFLEKLFAPRIL